MLTIYDEFAGVGGSSKGLTQIPGTELIFAANHLRQNVESHRANFPGCDHYDEDIARADITKFPRADIFWASPACPPWTDARGKKRDFDNSNQQALFWEAKPDPATKRARALMEEVPRYLREVNLRGGQPVLAGVVENVVQCRKWDEWQRWINEIRAEGYHTRVIAMNSMHAHAPRSARAPQSRNRLYVAYWHKSLKRTPDWNKWLRPRAYCPTCDRTVNALQAWKRERVDMGTYGRHGQYQYRCPSASCRHSVIEPEVIAASEAIDWTVEAKRIADRDEPLAQATMDRIRAGIAKFAEPLLIPTEGRPGKVAGPVSEPGRTQTARNETGLAVPSFHISLRGGGCRDSARPITDPLGTVSAGGNHHGLVPGQTLLVPYYGNGTARMPQEPLGTVPTRDRWALAADLSGELDLSDVRFRMLSPGEIGRAMAFPDDYIVVGNKRDQVRQYGNAVTPPVSEILGSALVEAITGEELEAAA